MHIDVFEIVFDAHVAMLSIIVMSPVIVSQRNCNVALRLLMHIFHVTWLWPCHPLQDVIIHVLYCCLPNAVLLQVVCSFLWCHPAAFCSVVLWIFSLSMVAVLCTSWSGCCSIFSFMSSPFPYLLENAHYDVGYFCSHSDPRVLNLPCSFVSNINLYFALWALLCL